MITAMFAQLPPLTRTLLIANAIVFLLQQVYAEGAIFAFGLWPLGEFRTMGGGVASPFLPWQVLTYGFLHGSLMHLAFNMLALLMFGGAIEQVWGTRRFAIYYFVCVVGAGLVQLVVATMAAREGNVYPTIGASGGVFGVLLAYGMLFPHHRVMLLFPPIPMKARTLVIAYGAMELFLGVVSTGSGVAHFAHLGGMLFGFLLIQYWRGRPPFPRRRR